MSYRRWSESNWYAFNAVSNTEQKEDEVLALWYAPMGLDGGCIDWLYSQVVRWTEDDVKEAYPDVSDDDATEAVEIIGEFVQDMDEIYERYGGRNLEVVD